MPSCTPPTPPPPSSRARHHRRVGARSNPNVGKGRLVPPYVAAFQAPLSTGTEYEHTIVDAEAHSTGEGRARYYTYALKAISAPQFRV